MNMGEEEVSWKSPSYRHKVIEQIQDARAESSTTSAVTKSSEELEEHVFNKAQSKDEYISLIARLILFLRNRSTIYSLVGEPPVPGFHPVKNGNGHRSRGSNGNHWGNPPPPYVGNSHHLPPYHHPHHHHQPSSTFVPRRQKRINPEEDLEKCHKFLSMCMQLTVCLTEKKKQCAQMLVQELIDGKLTTHQFVDKLLRELKAPKQPCLVSFIDKNLERLRRALVTGELWFAGIRPPGMEGPLPMPQNITNNMAPPHLPAGLGMEGEGRVIVPSSPQFFQPNMQINNHHNHIAMRPNHQPPQQQQQQQMAPPHSQPPMHVNNSQGSLCADLLTSSFPESGNVMQELFDFMGTGAQDTFTELAPMRQNQEVDNFMWGNNVNMNSNNMGQFAHPAPVSHLNNGSNSMSMNNGSNGMSMSHGSNGSQNHQPNMAMPPPSPAYPYQSGMRMQNTGVECLLSPQGQNNHMVPHPSSLPPATHPQTMHGVPQHHNGTITSMNGRTHLMQHMLAGYLDDKMQGFDDLDKHPHNGGNGI